jgi:hypothetical protein
MDPRAVVEAGVTIGTALVTVTVLGGLKIQKEIAEHKEKARLKEIAIVQEIFDETFKKIDPPAPPFFSGKPLAGAFLTSATLKTMAATTPMFDNKETDRCVRHILNAINHLVEWHQARLDRTNILWMRENSIDDITSSTISNLILLLSQNCIRFTDINLVDQYLEQTTEFIRKFAAVKKYNSFRKASLTPVLSELETAKFLLKSHSLSLSITELNKELLTVTDDVAIQFLMNTTQLIVRQKYRHLLDSFVPQRLAKGLLRYKMRYSEDALGVKVPKTEDMVALHKSILSDWMIKNVQDYLAALSLEDAPEDKGNFIHPEFFAVPNLKPLQDDLMAHFRECDNFLTLKAKDNDGTNAANELVTIDPTMLQERMEFDSKLQTLLHYLNIVRNFAAEFRDAMLEFGQRRYRRKPQDMVFMFGVVADLSKLINESTQRLGVDLQHIISSQANTMLTPERGSSVLSSIKTLLEKVSSKVCPELLKQVQWHNNNLLHHHPAPKTPIKSQKVKIGGTDRMLVLTHRIATGLHFPIHENVLLDLPPVPLLADTLSQTHKAFADVNQCINESQHKAEVPAVDIQRYRNAYTALSLLFGHTIQMSYETNTQRKQKSQHMLELILTYAEDMHSMLKKTVPEREHDMAAFANRIRTLTESTAHKIIDKRKDWTICFWKTTSRKLFDNVVDEVERVAHLRL